MYDLKMYDVQFMYDLKMYDVGFMYDLLIYVRCPSYFQPFVHPSYIVHLSFVHLFNNSFAVLSAASETLLPLSIEAISVIRSVSVRRLICVSVRLSVSAL